MPFFEATSGKTVFNTLLACEVLLRVIVTEIFISAPLMQTLELQ